MLEEICRLRAALGRVVFLWVPSHVGNSPNSMADAVAKTYLTQTPDAAGVARIAAAVRTRPCLYAARQGNGDAPALRDRRVYAEVYARSKAWACEQLRKGTTRGLVMGLERKMWTGLVKRVGVGMGLEADGEDRPKRRGVTAPLPAATRGTAGTDAAAPRAALAPAPWTRCRRRG